MTPLERSLIEKADYANGWENVSENSPDRVVIFSSRHLAFGRLLRRSAELAMSLANHAACHFVYS